MTLMNALQTHLLNKQSTNERQMRMKLHPSSIGMCSRKVIFDMMMLPTKPHDYQLSSVFDTGHAIHEKYQTYFREMGILVAEEQLLQGDGFSGHCDAIVRIQTPRSPFGELFVVDIKTAFSKSFEWMKKNQKAKKEYIEQINIYMYLSNIHQGIIYVENKDNQEQLELTVYYDEQLMNRIKEKAATYLNYATKRTVPPIQSSYVPSFYKCKQCSFNLYCHGEAMTQKKEIRYPIPFPEGSIPYKEAKEIQAAVKENRPIPDFYEEAETIGDMRRMINQKLNEKE